MPEFFLELFSEEIPARMQEIACRQLSVLATGCLQDITPHGTSVTEFYGPRRIAISFDVQSKVYATLKEQRGPRADASTQAVDGFLAKHKAIKDNLRIEDGYFILSTQTPERSARDVIIEKLPDHIAKLPWPKSMRWGQGGDFAWVRPLRRIACLLDGEVVPITLGPVTASNETEGHRVLGQGIFSVSSMADWEEKLRGHYVVGDQAKRRKKITDSIKDEAIAHGLSVAEDDALLHEVIGLVEWPVALIGKIDEQFMDLPSEVRELSMKVNQKYFAMRDAEGKPAPYFAFVANLEAPDGGAAIIAGNERVLRARLSDARHFWDLDLKTPLDELLPKLEKITFHAKIGTQRERADRIKERAGEIAHLLRADGDLVNQARHAGLLCKADLVTGMVGEFPELQGIMGGYYAEKNPRGWDGAVVGPAIKTHYQPKGPSDAVPSGIVAVSVALADKLDTLVQFFRINEKPTGSGDPYALRRAALGVIRIILENDLSLHLKPLLGGDQSLFDFIIERLRVKLRGDGKRFDVLDAVLAARADDDLAGLLKRVDALRDLLRNEDGKNLLAAYKRAANILKIEDAKDGPHEAIAVYVDFQSPEADDLRDELVRIGTEVSFAVTEGDYLRALTWFSKLRTPVDAFFDNVTVNDKDPKLRRNHLSLLARFRDTVHQIADFSKIEG
jgi:glycyl-tRNA synthetase beta chain